MFWFHGYKSEACSRFKHQEVILLIHQVKVYSKIILTAVMWTRTRNLSNYASKNPLQVASSPHPLCRPGSQSRELVPYVQLRMKHPALPWQLRKFQVWKKLFMWRTSYTCDLQGMLIISVPNSLNSFTFLQVPLRDKPHSQPWRVQLQLLSRYI